MPVGFVITLGCSIGEGACDPVNMVVERLIDCYVRETPEGRRFGCWEQGGGRGWAGWLVIAIARATTCLELATVQAPLTSGKKLGC